MHDFRRLHVWKLSRLLGVEIYRLCAQLARPEAKLITSQLRRSALSIATNIAEGCGKNSRAETIRYLEIASGSAAETEHQVIIALETRVLAATDVERLLVQVRSTRRMLRSLIARLPSSERP